MPNFSYGPNPQSRVQQLLEILIDCANCDLDENLGRIKLDARWEEENQKNQENQKDRKKYHIAVETTLEELRVLLYGSARLPEKVKKNKKKDIGGLLTHYLERLELWEDRRGGKHAGLVNGVLL
jgi:hypothetical protein